MNKCKIIYNDIEFEIDPILFSQASSVFEANYDEDQTMIISGKISASRFQEFLPFVQGSSSQITQNNIEDLKSFAEDWEIPQLDKTIEAWENQNSGDSLINEFLDKCRRREPVTSMIPELAEKINELINKPQFNDVLPKILQTILASPKCEIKNYHSFYQFIVGYVSKDIKNRLFLLNHLDPAKINKDDLDEFFVSDLLPDDQSLLSQIPIFLTKLMMTFHTLYLHAKNTLDTLNNQILQQDRVLTKKQQEFDDVHKQLNAQMNIRKQEKKSKSVENVHNKTANRYSKTPKSDRPDNSRVRVQLQPPKPFPQSLSDQLIQRQLTKPQLQPQLQQPSTPYPYPDNFSSMGYYPFAMPQTQMDPRIMGYSSRSEPIVGQKRVQLSEVVFQGTPINPHQNHVFSQLNDTSGSYENEQYVSPASEPHSAPKLIPKISVEKPRSHITSNTNDSVTALALLASQQKKPVSVKIERPQKGTVLELLKKS